MSAPALELRALRAGYGRDAPVLDDVDLTVPAGSLTALLGPSGCGKSTLLRVVAGLLAPDAGDVTVGGASVLGVPAERRPVGLVFQKALLFGHLSVGDNVGFGLRMRGVAARDRRHRVREALDLVGLPDLAARRPGELSGGQEQRVALARALVLDPQVLLLDEPFSQLDADLRVRMRELVARVQRELAMTTVFVTHDQQEAVDLADSIALLLDGRLQAHADPAAFYTRPPSLAAARFFGVTNEIPGTFDDGVFRCALGSLRVAAGASPGPGVLVVRPESLRLVSGDARPDGPGSPGSGPSANLVAGSVVETRFRGTHRTVVVRLPHRVALTVTLPPDHPAGPGDTVTVHLPPDACTVLPAEHDGPPATLDPDESEHIRA
ncbi:iron(III) transport system ATP-binding protein [Pseudonocardia sediminis]|uniref:ABC-type quaternary amine transporter n=1 Tax=Pseudonocardia sediminis TaxID=1397368 RepID=A0A4Q7UQM2_PSEST|nr:ABC transporter ATP-binding protein [Pseudonocardia sediminis]RZT83856.1 iron(III) transport system ATP-binding protein [Pseudonocardia sediminis]